jgi:hypothetical protein
MNINTKKCISCGQDKCLDEFSFTKGKPREKCKICLKQYMNDHYNKNKTTYIDYSKTKQKYNKEWFNKFKSTLKCTQCGENHPAVLDFHNVDPNTKDKNVSEMIKFSIKKKIKANMIGGIN